MDEFIARIEATLSGNAQPGHAITAADVQAATVNATRHGGYEELTMDEVLDRYAHELDKLTPFPPFPRAVISRLSKLPAAGPASALHGCLQARDALAQAAAG